jgi:hypothetical protein
MIQALSPERALTNLAQVLVEGTQADAARIWLARADQLEIVAYCPGLRHDEPRILTPEALQEVDLYREVRDKDLLRGAITVIKPQRALTPADQRLVKDVAQGAKVLLRGVQLAAELQEERSWADELNTQLQRSQQRLAQARALERQRQAAKLTQVTTSHLASLRDDIVKIREHVSRGEVDNASTKKCIDQARDSLNEVADRFRVLARGSYSTALRSHGPVHALNELATDLPRLVRVSGSLPPRLSWEIETGIFWLADSVLRQLAAAPAKQPLRVQLEYTERRLAVRIEDPISAIPDTALRAALADDIDLLVVLGGAVKITKDGVCGIVVGAWLPDQLEPAVAPGPAGRAHL